MARTGLFPFADRIMEGTLAERLTQWRNEGLSYDSIAHRLYADHDIEVTGRTIQRWCNIEEAA